MEFCAEDNNCNEQNLCEPWLRVEVEEERHETVQEENYEEFGRNPSSEEDEDEAEEEEIDECRPFLRLGENELIVPLLAADDMTSRDHLIAILAMSIRHRSTYENILSQLKWAKLSTLHSDLPTDKPSLWKVLSKDTSILVRHYFCKRCKGMIGQDEITNDCLCENAPQCGPGKKNSEANYFLQVKIRPQLKELLESDVVAQAFNYRFRRVKKNELGIEDLPDGIKYQEKCEPGQFLSNPNNRSMMLNADGIELSNSGVDQCWVGYLTLNELPPHLRKKYSLIVAVYVGEGHPIMNELFKPMTVELQDLYANGITWYLNGETITSKFIVNICCVDSKARPELMNMLQPNGKCSCTFCVYEGEPAPNNNLHRLYPSHEVHPRRTHQQICDDMMLAHETGPVRGILGVSFLAAIPELDLGTGVVVDPMHNCYLGVTRHVFRLLLFSKAEETFYYGTPQNLAVINARLLQIKPPNCISRKPVSIHKWRKWKATEWRNLLLYMLPCFENVVPDNILRFLAKLCEALYILHKSSILPEEVQKCKRLLLQFHFEFEDIFGKIHMTYNLHMLVFHLPDCVLEYGPGWAISAFIFEALNYDIIRFVTSPKDRQLQIVTRFLMKKFVEASVNDVNICDRTKRFVKDQLKRCRYQRSEVFVGIGTPTEESLGNRAVQVMREAGFDNVEEVDSYKKVQVHGIDYRKHDKNSTTKFCDSYLCYNNDRFGKILGIISFEYGNTRHNGFLIKQYRRSSFAFHTSHIENVVSSRVIYIDSSQVVSPAVVIKTTLGLRAIALPNLMETD